VWSFVLWAQLPKANLKALMEDPVAVAPWRAKCVMFRESIGVLDPTLTHDQTVR
jgi:hypothetical protein